MKTVYFVRHGESEGNAKNLFQTPVEELTEEGTKQAESVAERFSSIPVDIILSSPMTRARNTALRIAKIKGKEIVENVLFEEVKRPTSLHGLSKNEPHIKEAEDLLMEYFGDSQWRHSDEENYFDLEVRAKKALEFILSRKEENIVVSTHGFILRMMFSVVLMGDDLTPEVFKHINGVMRTLNTGITKMTHDDARGWQVWAWNDHAHLG